MVRQRFANVATASVHGASWLAFFDICGRSGLFVAKSVLFSLPGGYRIIKRQQPDARVAGFIRKAEKENLFLSVMSIGEIGKGYSQPLEGV